MLPAAKLCLRYEPRQSPSGINLEKFPWFGLGLMNSFITRDAHDENSAVGPHSRGALGGLRNLWGFEEEEGVVGQREGEVTGAAEVVVRLEAEISKRREKVERSKRRP